MPYLCSLYAGGPDSNRMGTALEMLHIGYCTFVRCTFSNGSQFVYNILCIIFIKLLSFFFPFFFFSTRVRKEEKDFFQSFSDPLYKLVT